MTANLSPTVTSAEYHFGQALLDKAAERGRLCVGIDPHAHLLSAWGLDDTVDGLECFTMTCVEAFADTAALVKPQVAFFERFGSAGFAVLERALEGLRAAGCLVLADAKRGDIGSTMAGYADAWLGEGAPLRVDSLTVSSYLGVGALEPVFDKAAASGAGLFVLAATSNPEALDLQSTVCADGRSIAQSVVDACAQRNAAAGARTGADTNAGPIPVGDIGVVVGATLRTPPRLDQLHGPVLLPGVGAQGAGAEDVKAIMGDAPQWGFASVSRSVLSHGPDVSSLRNAVRAQAAEFGA